MLHRLPSEACIANRPPPFSRARALATDDPAPLAPTGSGKGIAVVLPNLLDYLGSVVTTDIKGEAYAVSARFRRHTSLLVSSRSP